MLKQMYAVCPVKVISIKNDQSYWVELVAH